MISMIGVNDPAIQTKYEGLVSSQSSVWPSINLLDIKSEDEKGIRIFLVTDAMAPHRAGVMYCYYLGS